MFTVLGALIGAIVDVIIIGILAIFIISLPFIFISKIIKAISG